jgi:signal transduction histidine kinase/ActR/RegA family two-component response regulator
MTIRSHLMLLAIGAIVPIVVFAILVSVLLVEQDRLTLERAATDRARAMMTAVDAELRGSVTSLLALAASPLLQANDLRAFHAEAARVLATQPAWVDVTLARASGEKVIDALKPYGHPPERTLDPASVAAVVSTKGIAIGNVDRFGDASPPALPIRVPVEVDGRVSSVLSALVRPESFENLIRDQRLPDGWISGIVDANGRFVARVPPRPAGSEASVAFRAAVIRAAEGWYRGPTADGRDTFTAFKRSDFSRWSIGLAIPTEIVQAAAMRTSWLMGIGIASSIVLALGVALLLGRRIAGPVAALATVARSVGSGEAQAARVPDTVHEVSAVATALREADVAVRERAGLVEREKAALQQADRAKDEFIAALSHELRNPLAALTAAAHILRVAGPSHAGAAADARGVIERQTKHMSRMIEDLLDVSRLIAGKANLVIETFDLAPLAAQTVGAWRAAGRFTGQAVTLDTQSAWVSADRTRVEQILSNLLDNAVKFTPPGCTIAVRVGAEGDASVLAVTDDGEGIEPALAARVFDLFVQGDQDVGRSKGGIGLGLALVKRLVELQGGFVRVDSPGRGRGATFTVRLPAAAPVAPLVPGPTLRSAKPASVLIVEDNEDAREMLRQVLAMQGHEVCEAADGTAAVALAAAREPDVAIVDIGLPDIDGYEVARRIRQQARRRVALIALTGYGQPEDQRRARDAGFDLHLVKPVTVERLDHAIASLDSSSVSSLRLGD